MSILPVLLLGSFAAPLESAEPLREHDAAAHQPASPGADRKLYFGMWTLHFRDIESGIENNWAAGLAWNGFYCATFINSFDVRAYTAGIQGEVAGWDAGRLSIGIGYRAGLVTGYDERLTSWAAKTPVIPLLQPRITAQSKRFGLELSYSGVIASAGLSYSF